VAYDRRRPVELAVGQTPGNEAEWWIWSRVGSCDAAPGGLPGRARPAERLFGEISGKKQMRLLDARIIGEGLAYLTYELVPEAASGS